LANGGRAEHDFLVKTDRTTRHAQQKKFKVKNRLGGVGSLKKEKSNPLFPSGGKSASADRNTGSRGPPFCRKEWAQSATGEDGRSKIEITGGGPLGIAGSGATRKGRKPSGKEKKEHATPIRASEG